MFKKLSFDNLTFGAIFGSAIGTLSFASLGGFSHIRDSQSSATSQSKILQPYLNKSSVDSFNKNGYLIIKNALPIEEIAQIKLDIIELGNQGRMSSGSDNASGVGTRNDSICWIRASDGTSDGASEESRGYCKIPPGLLKCIALLRGTTFNLEYCGYNRSNNHKIPQQLQIGRFSGDMKSIYKAHRDSSANDNFWDIGFLGWLKSSDYRCRSITVILYVNAAEWDCDPSRDGGALRCYLGADMDDDTGVSSKSILNVSPSSGTIILFDSRYLLHEVCPSNSTRYAVTLWVNGDKT